MMSLKLMITVKKEKPKKIKNKKNYLLIYVSLKGFAKQKDKMTNLLRQNLL